MTANATAREYAPSLGSLLHRFRIDAGESTKTVSRRCALGVVAIAQLELERADLSADELAEVVAAYAVPRLVFPLDHSLVHVDLVGGTVSVTVTGEDTTIVESTADKTLLAYLELVFASGALEASMTVPFTALDLDVLRVVLASRRDDVTRHLEDLVVASTDDVVVVSSRRTERIVMLTLAVAALIAAGAVLATTPPPATADKSPVVPVVAPVEVELIDPLVVERGPDGEIRTVPLAELTKDAE